jgi:hypothetical protein
VAAVHAVDDREWVLTYRPALVTAWRLWRTHFPAFIPVAIVIVAPLLILGELLDRWLVGGTVSEVVSFLVLGIAATAFAEALCAGVAEEVLHAGASHAPRSSLFATIRRLPLLRLTILAVIIGVAVAVGTIALIVPGLAIFAWLCVACTTAIVERRGVVASLRNSVRLVRGNFWAVAALTTTAVVFSDGVEALLELLHGAHPPLWVTIIVDALVETAVISLTAAVIVVVFQALRARHHLDAGYVEGPTEAATEAQSSR